MPAATTQSASPGPSSQPELQAGWLSQTPDVQKPAAVGSFSRQETSQLLTVAAGLRRVAPSLSDETRKLFEKHPELTAVLAGILPAVSVPVSKDCSAELMKIVDALSVSTRQSIEISDEGEGKDTLIIHNGAIEKIAPQLVSPAESQFRCQWHLWTPETHSLLGTVHLGGAPSSPTCDQTGPLAVLEPHLEARQAERAEQIRDCKKILESGSGIRPPAPTTPRKIGMISYVSSDYQYERLTKVLQEWKQNLQEFGHHHVALQLCDDSPQPYGGRIQKLLTELSENGPNSFHYLGPEQKSQIQKELTLGLKKTMSAQDADSVATLIAGAGPTQNRNLSLQLLGASGGLQIDHDMTAEVLTTHFDQPLPYDLLGALEKAPQDQLSSLRFCGADDQSIELILAAPLPALKSKAWLTTENRQPENPLRLNSLEDGAMGGGLRAPMHVPSSFNPAARISPGLRDGDLALGSVAEAFGGKHPEELPQSVFHRDTAGSRWGGASLLTEFLKFATVYYVFEELRQSGDRSQSLSTRVLDRLKPEAPPLTQFQDLWCYETSKTAVEGFLKERQDKQQLLKLELGKLRYPSRLETWSGQPGTPKNRKQASSEIRQVVKRLETETQDMRQKMHIKKGGQIDAAALTADLHGDVQQILRSHALAMAHGDQIAALLLPHQSP